MYIFICTYINYFTLTYLFVCSYLQNPPINTDNYLNIYTVLNLQVGAGECAYALAFENTTIQCRFN